MVPIVVGLVDLSPHKRCGGGGKRRFVGGVRQGGWGGGSYSFANLLLYVGLKKEM